MSERSERMTAEPVYYYECQERAMAPGIGDGWPEVIAAPHTKNARLVRREGDPAQLRTDLATANERVRAAREGLEKSANHLKVVFESYAKGQTAAYAREAWWEARDTLSRLNAKQGDEIARLSRENAEMREVVERLPRTDNQNQTNMDTLAQLWELSGEGKAEWWPERLHPGMEEWWYTNSDGFGNRIDPQDALDLVTASAERWLWVEREIAYCPQADAYICIPEDCCEVEDELPDALRYAMVRLAHKLMIGESND